MGKMEVEDQCLVEYEYLLARWMGDLGFRERNFISGRPSCSILNGSGASGQYLGALFFYEGRSIENEFLNAIIYYMQDSKDITVRITSGTIITAILFVLLFTLLFFNPRSGLFSKNFF